jgi:glutathione S-transferase
LAKLRGNGLVQNAQIDGLAADSRNVGLAGITKSEEASMLELYHNNVSVCAQKVRVVLAEKNLPWTNHHLSLARGEQLTSEFKKMNPRGVVPVLVHDGNTIVESSVICAYLDEVFPHPPLMPKNPVERATMRLWCKLPDDILHMACATVSFAISFGQQLKKQAGTGLEERLMKMPDPARRERQRALIEKGIETPFFRDHIKVFEKTFGEMEAQLHKTKWLASDMITLADIEITPYVERIDRLGLAGMWEDRPRLADWFNRIKARPSFKAISDFPPSDYDDTGRDGLKNWPRIKELIAV